MNKWTFQLRNRNITILVSLDIGGYPHPNPDRAPTGELHPFEGRRIECPHLQRHVVGFEDRWAIPAPSDLVQDDMDQTWYKFLDYCRVTEMPPLQGVLW